MLRRSSAQRADPAGHFCRIHAEHLSQFYDRTWLDLLHKARVSRGDLAAMQEGQTIRRAALCSCGSQTPPQAALGDCWGRSMALTASLTSASSQTLQAIAPAHSSAIRFHTTCLHCVAWADAACDVKARLLVATVLQSKYCCKRSYEWIDSDTIVAAVVPQGMPAPPPAPPVPLGPVIQDNAGGPAAQARYSVAELGEHAWLMREV